MVTCYIGLGSNLGDRQYYIDSAVRKVRALSLTRVRRLSGVIETEPQGGPPQGMYLNAVMEIETELGPYELLRELQRIEAGLGRVRSVANAPRTIDLDILTYGDFSIEEEALRIPHPRIPERDFVLVPLAQIAPAALIRSLKRQKQVKRKPARKKHRSDMLHPALIVAGAKRKLRHHAPCGASCAGVAPLRKKR